ncbi:hypothetical protein B0T18DRAFT_416598 [Schizothecium vesticola]|uniref:Uncharacterized protein n=1 Tax=Schizothecium vesticola TaxID=314040 RepID=A0AA40K326_9PEZI|nr:hypothetical protein B0T18DRAFT_416598 [Schizothecium vesticola]
MQKQGHLSCLVSLEGGEPLHTTREGQLGLLENNSIKTHRPEPPLSSGRQPGAGVRKQIDKTLLRSRTVGRQRDGYARYQDDDAHHRWSKQGGSGAGPAPQTLQRLPTRLRRRARERDRRLAEQMRVCGRVSTASWPNGTCRYPSLHLVLCCAVLCCAVLRRGFQGAIITPTRTDSSANELDKNTYASAPPNKQGLGWPRVPLMHAQYGRDVCLAIWWN